MIFVLFLFCGHYFRSQFADVVKIIIFFTMKFTIKLKKKLMWGKTAAKRYHRKLQPTVQNKKNLCTEKKKKGFIQVLFQWRVLFLN